MHLRSFNITVDRHTESGLLQCGHYFSDIKTTLMLITSMSLFKRATIMENGNPVPLFPFIPYPDWYTISTSPLFLSFFFCVFCFVLVVVIVYFPLSLA